MTTSATTPQAYTPPAPSSPPPEEPSAWRAMVERELELLKQGDSRQTETNYHPKAGERVSGRWRSLSHEYVTRPCRDLVGIALSGGGIRSATFNLGLLQGLHDLKLIAAFDYLSTVSGGGYIGAFWSAWRSRPNGKAGEFPSVKDDECPECPEIQHLRQFSNFLSPRVGVLSYDTGRMVGSLVSGFVPTMLASLAVIMGVLYVWLLLAQLLFADGLKIGTAKFALVAPLTMALLTAVVLVAAEVLWRRRKEPGNWRNYLTASLFGVAAATAAWWWMAGKLALPYPPATATSAATFDAWVSRVPILASRQRSIEWLALLGPAGAWGAAALTLVGWRVLASRFGSTLSADPGRGTTNRVLSRLIYVAAVWSAFCLVWYAGAIVWHWIGSDNRSATLTGMAGAATALSLAFSKLQRLFGREPSKGMGASTLAQLGRRAPQILAYAALAAIVCAVVLLVAIAIEGGWIVWLLAGMAAVTLVVFLFFDPNEVGLHSFYRGRLARAYLGASNPNAVLDKTTPDASVEQAEPARSPRKSISTLRAKAEVLEGDDIEITKLENNRPLHLVCCAANDLDSADPIGTLRRGAASAVLSPAGFSVGSAAVCWNANLPDRDVPSLSAAITASGAAFNSQMGAKSMELGPAVTFLMSMFNLRLGLWLPHPTWGGWTDTKRFWSRAGSLPGQAFYGELFGRSRADGRHVHLSDGGHFENMGLFELLRRHCRYVIASDCGCDPDVAFDDFGNLVRRAREDLGIEIEIDLTPLRPPKDGFARQPMVAGDIHYPNGDVGVLLLFKPTLVGNEPVDVRQYHDRNKRFPHESTGDQFYDEAQWEAYRRLGVHAARSAFLSVLEAAEPRQADSAYFARVFAQARRHWLPAPEGLVDRLPRLASSAAELDASLRKQENEAVQREVYREIAGLLNEPPRDHSAAELTKALGIVRQALLFMEETFVCEDLDRRGGHPLYLGLVNYFARWTHSPLVRAWWPVLRTMHSQRFARYLEARLGMTTDSTNGVFAAAEVSDTSFSGKEPGALAARSWHAEGRSPAWDQDPGSASTTSQRLTLSLIIPLVLEPNARCDVQVAQVIMRRAHKLLAWDAADFYVSPSLWGAGIGEAFLRLLSEGKKSGDATNLLVRIRSAERLGPAARKEGADLTQMYRAGGFREVWPLRGNQWQCGGEKIELGLGAAPGAPWRWLWRRTAQGAAP